MNRQEPDTSRPSRAREMLDKALGDADDVTPEKAENGDAPENRDVPRTPPVNEPDKDKSEEPDNKVKEKNDTEFRTPFDKKDDAPADKAEDTTSDRDDFDKETDRKIEEMNKDPHPGEAFRELRKELKEEKAKRLAYETGEVKPEQVAELETKAQRAEQLAQENKELQARLAEIDYRFTDDYKQNVERPFEDIAELAATLESRNGLDENAILSAITKADYNAQSEAIEMLKEAVDPRSFTTINQMADQVITLFRREEAIQKNSQELLSSSQEREAERRRMEKQKETEAYKLNVSKTFDSYQDKIPLFIGDDGMTNDTFDSLKQQASELSFDEMTVEDKAFAALSSVSIGPLIRSHNNMRKELTALRLSNQSSDKSTMRPPESDGSPQSGDDRPVVEGRDFQSYIKKQLDKATF